MNLNKLSKEIAAALDEMRQVLCCEADCSACKYHIEPHPICQNNYTADVIKREIRKWLENARPKFKSFAAKRVLSDLLGEKL